MRVRWGKRHYEQGKSRSRIVDLNSASISMDVSDDKLFDNIKKGINIMIFLKEIQNAVTILLTLGWQKNNK